MRFKLVELAVSCRKYEEVITFGRFMYIYGKMGAGKSSIARLVDFCLGGRLELTPALQSEFVAATLFLQVGPHAVSLERARGSSQVRARWESTDGWTDVVVPARQAGEEVLPTSGVRVLSDLVFYLAGIEPPKVRRSKLDEDSDLERLSLRNLLWYCYLDQDTIDSQFFHLEQGSDFSKRNKSRDVLRMVVGFHQEQVAELEGNLERLRQERLTLLASADALRAALSSTGIASADDINDRLGEIAARRAAVSAQIERHRTDLTELRTHAADELRMQGRALAERAGEYEDAIVAATEQLQEERRHLNELLSLSTRFRRLSAARNVLQGVEFTSCPMCLRSLPDRVSEECRLCGRGDDEQTLESDIEATDADITSRSAELRDAMTQRATQVSEMKRQLADIRGQKTTVDQELTSATAVYDSAYLSAALAAEHEVARLDAEATQLRRLSVLPAKVIEQQLRAGELAVDETLIRNELRELRKAAEADNDKIDELARLFLDCLLRARIPGFTESDVVQIRPPWLLPNVTSATSEALTVTSFSNLGSGGKKTLFKCCFALAVHRLAAQQGALLPRVLIIDSPMKNISERENREQFEGFHELLYELASGELAETQFVIIDKEHFAPKVPVKYDIAVRHMSPDEDPLLRGYRGH